MSLRTLAILIAVLVLGGLAARSAYRQRIETAAALEAACHGPALRTDEARNQAMNDGYVINRQFDCIDKASYAVEADARARWDAARTPEAQAKAAEDRALRIAAEEAQTAAARAEQLRTAEAAPRSPAPFRLLDVNTATVDELAGIAGVGPATAAALVEERGKRPFTGWPDVVHRVTGLSSARNAVFASVGGLTVNGASLEGAPADPAMAAMAGRPQP